MKIDDQLVNDGGWRWCSEHLSLEQENKDLRHAILSNFKSKGAEEVGGVNGSTPVLLLSNVMQACTLCIKHMYATLPDADYNAHIRLSW